MAVVRLPPMQSRPGSDRRARMFAAGRRCANEALGLAEGREGLLARRDSGAPDWPAGWAGSITHSRCWAAAVAGPRTRFIGLGLDAEQSNRVPAHLLGRIAGRGERTWLERRPPELHPVARTLLFGAKEAVFKCVHPLLAAPFDFNRITILEPQPDGTFFVRLSAPWVRGLPRGSVLAGRHIVALGHVWVGVALLPGRPERSTP